jgi:hypothetical protein
MPSLPRSIALAEALSRLAARRPSSSSDALLTASLVMPLQYTSSRMVTVCMGVCVSQWQVTRLCFEADTEPYAKTRDAAVAAAAAASGVTVHSPTSHTLYVVVPRSLAICCQPSTGERVFSFHQKARAS